MTANAVAPSVRGATWNEILSILAPRRWRILGIALAVVAGAALELVPPLLMRQIVDGHLAVRQWDGLVVLALLYLAATAGVQGVGFLANYLTAWTAQGALNELRVRLYSHFQRLPLSYHDRTPLGEIISRCTADIETVDTLFSSGVAGLVTDMVRLVTVSIAMIILSPLLSLVSALAVPPLAWITNAFRVRIREAERESRVAVGMLNTDLQEILGGVEVIRAFSREPAFVARFRHTLRRTLLAFNRAASYSAVYSPLMQILLYVAIALLLWVGGRAAFAAWNLSLGTLTAFVLLFKRFFDPITALGEEWQTVQSALSGAERIFQVLGMPVEVRPSGLVEPTAQSPGRGEIQVNEVTFGYFPDQPVLGNVSFMVHPGEHVALVGRTGAGKSSILHLLGGLYAPWQGQVRIAGLDPRQIEERGRRRIVGVVPQVVQLFSGTVRENLTLGDRSVPSETIEQAAQISGADAFIRALPQGYDTPISTHRGSGVQLSSGQRQLLALTRALVWDPQVLLFDEATSAIDSASEAAFRDALRNQATRRQRAILTVAHRLSTAREADRVIVLEEGHILESGTPEELIRKRGRFAALLELEAAGWDWRTG